MRRTTNQRPVDGVPLGQDNTANLDHDVLVGQVRTLLAEAQALSARLAALIEVAVAMQGRLDVDSVLQTMVQQARWVLDFQHCSIALRESDHYRYLVLRGDNTHSAQKYHLGADAVSRTLQHGHATLLGELTPLDDAPSTMRSALLLPLRDADQVIGTLNFFSTAPNHYTQDDLRIAYALAVQVGAILQNVRFFNAATTARDELHTVLESIRDAVLVFSPQGKVVLVNSALRTLLHLGEQPIINRHVLALLRLAHFNQHPLISLKAVRPLIKTLTLNDGRESHGTVRLNDGRTIEWAIAPLLAGGQAQGYVLTGRDISARVDLDQLREDLIHMLVHDLRSPVSSMLLSFDLIQIAQETGDMLQQGEMLAVARRAARRLLDQVNTMLDVSKLEAGRLELERSPVWLPELVQTVVTAFTPTAQREERTIQLLVDENVPILAVDLRLMQRVFENLLGNAIKFTPRHGQITMGVRLLEQGGIEGWVQDTGPGIPEEQRSYIFEKFAQVQGSEAHRGTGLGLAFCKLVVDAHGGEIGVRSAQGGGSVFWLRLPLIPAS